MAAVAEHMELRWRDQVVQADAGLDRDNAVVAAMDDQGFFVQCPQSALVTGERPDVALARCRIHPCVGVLLAGPDASLVAHVHQVVGNDGLIVGKKFDQFSHILVRRFIRPHGFEPRRNLEIHAR